MAENKSKTQFQKQKAEATNFNFFSSEENSGRFCRGIESDKLESFFSSSLTDSLFKKTYRAIAGIFEQLLGVKFLIEPPEIFKDIDPVLWPVFKKIISLKDKSLIDGFFYNQPLFNDEPKFITFNICLDKGISGSGEGYAGGKSLYDRKKVLLSALGETVERISFGNYCPPNMLVSSFSELGDKAVNPELFSGLNQEKRREIQKSSFFKKYHPGATLAFDEETKFRWIEARSFLDGKKAHVPFQLVSSAVHSAYRNKRNSDEPFIRFPLSTGAAAGETTRDALLNGMLEVIERDAFMTTWLNQLSPELIDLEAAPENLRKIFRMFKRYNLEFYVAVMPTDFDIPVFLGLAIDRSGIGPAVAVASKACFDLSDGIESVAADALAARLAMRMRMINAGSPDLSHLGLGNRSFYWYPVKMIKEIKFLTQGEKKPFIFFEKKYSAVLAHKSTQKRTEFLSGRLRKLNLDAYFVETTDQRLSYLRIPAVMALIPGMQALYVDECFRYTDGERLKTVPQKFGFKPLNNLPLHPHPFA